MKIRKSKSETRRKSETRNPKPEKPMGRSAFRRSCHRIGTPASGPALQFDYRPPVFRISDFGLPSDFGFSSHFELRTSDFELLASPA